MKKLIFVIIAVSTLLIPIVAQTKFDDYKKSKESEFNNFRDKTQKEFESFRQKKNAEFAEFLRQKWEKFDAKPQVKPKEEKPVPPVIYEDDKKPEPAPAPTPAPTPQPTPKPQPAPVPVPNPIPIDNDVVVIPKPKPQPEPIEPIVIEDKKPVNTEYIEFYGTKIAVDFPKDDGFRLKGVKDNDFADGWAYLMDDKYDVCIKSALDTRSKLQLCDYAYLSMIKAITKKHYGNTNEATFMMGYLLVQSGYKIRLGHSATKLYVLYASDYNVFNTPFYTLDGVRFYPIDCNEKSLNISSASFEGESLLSLQIFKEQKLAMNQTPIRNLKSSYGVQTSVCVNKNVIDFYNDYPQSYINNDATTTWIAYANTPLESSVKDKLYPALKSVINGKSNRDAVNKLLNFVQTAFVYEYDDKVWGRDRAFFATETLYYPSCDCEDRSILFSRLVRDLLGLDVVLLYYPGHLATAVNIPELQTGDYLMVNGKRYTVCDPTYINAPVGRTMPGMDNKVAKVIMLSK